MFYVCKYFVYHKKDVWTDTMKLMWQTAHLALINVEHALQLTQIVYHVQEQIEILLLTMPYVCKNNFYIR